MAAIVAGQSTAHKVLAFTRACIGTSGPPWRYTPAGDVMEITTRMSGTVTVVDLSGKLTADRGVAQFAETIRGLLDNGQTRIVVNMDAHYIDDAGINEIINAYKAVQGHGGTIKLLNPFRRIGPGLTVICKLLTVFDVYDDEAKAIASFGDDKA